MLYGFFIFIFIQIQGNKTGNVSLRENNNTFHTHTHTHSPFHDSKVLSIHLQRQRKNHALQTLPAPALPPHPHSNPRHSPKPPTARLHKQSRTRPLLLSKPEFPTFPHTNIHTHVPRPVVPQSLHILLPSHRQYAHAYVAPRVIRSFIHPSTHSPSLPFPRNAEIAPIHWWGIPPGSTSLPHHPSQSQDMFFVIRCAARDLRASLPAQEDRHSLSSVLRRPVLQEREGTVFHDGC